MPIDKNGGYLLDIMTCSLSPILGKEGEIFVSSRRSNRLDRWLKIHITWQKWQFLDQIDTGEV